MLNLLSLLIGGTALIFVAIAFIPFLGVLNWFIAPFAVIGLGLGALSSHKSGRNLNLVVLGVAALRLVLGAGIF